MAHLKDWQSGVSGDTLQQLHQVAQDLQPPVVLEQI